MIYISTGIAILMGIMVLIIRNKASKKPTNIKKIILPPLFMSSGALMFLFPVFRITKWEIIEVVVAGFLFSILLIKTSKFEVRDNQIYMKRSKAFAFILIGLLVIRSLAKILLSESMDLGEMSGMFFLLAFCMLLPWRIAMYFQFRKIHNLNFGNNKIAKV